MIGLALGLVAAAAALVSLPGTLELAVLTLAGLLPTRKRGEEAPPPLQVIAVVPAHDESAGIVRCIESLRACDGAEEHFSIVVVADNCTDDTADRAREAGAEVLERRDARRKGKGAALEWTFARVLDRRPDAVLVVDADSVVDPDLIDVVRRRIAAGADALQVRYGVENSEESLRTRLAGIALMAFNVLRLRGRERLGLSVGILGNGFALSRATLEAVPFRADSIVEDHEYHLRLVRAGLRVRFAGETSVRAPVPAGGRAARSQRARWEGGRLRLLRETGGTLFSEVRRGKLRLLEPLGELLLLPLAFHVLLVLAAFVGPLWFVRAYATFALGVLVTHVLGAIVVGGGGLRDVAALAAAPLYVIWKLTLARAISRASRPDATWVRTERATSGAERR